MSAMNFDEFKDKVFAAALSIGCEAAEAFYVESERFTVRILEQETDSYSVSRSGGFGLRVKLGGRDGYAYTELLDEPEKLAARAADNARVIESGDEHPMQARCEYPEIKRPENPVAGLDERGKIALAKELEQRCKAADPRVKRVSADLFSSYRSTVRICNTLGLDAHSSDSGCYCYVSPVMEEAGELHDGFAFRFGAACADTAACAAEAVEEGAAQFGAQPVEAGSYRILLRNDAAGDLLDTFSSIFSAEKAQRGLSPVANSLGCQIAAETLTIVDDPLYPEFPRAFDDEGTPSEKTVVVENGRLNSLLHNLKTAKKAGVRSTSNAGRASAASPVDVAPSNFYILPGDKSFDELVSLLGDGLIITEVSGLHSGANAVTGDFSLIAKGRLVENGRVVRPVERITVAGSFLTLMRDIEHIGSDLKFGIPSGSCIGSPSLLIKGLIVSGK